VRRHRIAASACLSVACVFSTLAACTLDFDRYDPSDAAAPQEGGAEASADASMNPEAASPNPDAGPPDAIADAGTTDAGKDSGACTPPPGCIAQTTTCGASCGQDFDGCTQACDAQACITACRTPEQGCLGKCISTCLACTLEGGCMSSSACLNAAQP
jgi:hypothetical protein